MGKVYRFMGLTVGLVIHGVMGPEKKAAYDADITYGTNNEFGFDYLRDNMAIYSQELVQRGHSFAIVDEVDSILIDEARTPLIISGQGEKSTQLYTMVDQFVSRLKCKRIAKVDEKEEEDADIDADYVVDEKARTATLTARGIKKAEEFFHLENLADPENTTLSHHINQAIKARGVMKRDIDYVVKDGEVIIVDEFTGRLMFGRRYNEGLHQAIEAKEHVHVAQESKTLATITFQNYFRLYDKLSGMTGTAMTEQEEFGTIYELDIVEIPTNKPMRPYGPPRRGVQERARASSGPSSTRSRSATRRASPCWWAPSPSRSPRSCLTCSKPPGHQAQRAQRQEPREGSRDRGPGRQVRAPSPWPPTWPAAAPTSCWAATPSIWPRPTCERPA